MKYVFFAFATIFLLISNSTAHDHLSNLDDITVCLGKSGDGITPLQYEFVDQYQDKLRTKAAELGTKRRGHDYALEALNRNLDWSKCNKLISKSVSLSIDNNSTLTSSISTTKDSSTEKAKLRELKSLLDDGLISQEQYDDKSSKILDEY